MRPSGRYERQTQQDATLKQLGAAELGVQVGFKATGAAADGVPPPPPQQGAAPPPPPPQRSSSRPDAAAAQRQQVSRSEQHRRQVAAHTAQAPQRQHRGTPIVMVPPGMTALLNMHNARSFLEKGEFQTTEEAKVGCWLGCAPCGPAGAAGSLDVWACCAALLLLRRACQVFAKSQRTLHALRSPPSLLSLAPLANPPACGSAPTPSRRSARPSSAPLAARGPSSSTSRVRQQPCTASCQVRLVASRVCPGLHDTRRACSPLRTRPHASATALLGVNCGVHRSLLSFGCRQGAGQPQRLGPRGGGGLLRQGLAVQEVALQGGRRVQTC